MLGILKVLRHPKSRYICIYSPIAKYNRSVFCTYFLLRRIWRLRSTDFCTRIV